MAEYTELIKALRHCYEDDDACATCQRWLAHDEWGIKCKGRLISDAAAAIEALEAKVPHWVSVKERLPEPNIQCLVRDDDNNCAVGYYRQDAKAWDSPFFGWLERDDEYYKDGDLCRIGKVVAWMPIEPPQEVQDDS